MEILNGVIYYWKRDWRDNRTLFLVELAGVILSLFAAGLLAFLAHNAPMLFIFSTYSVANFMMISAAFMRGSSWLIILNLMFFFLNVAGFYNNL